MTDRFFAIESKTLEKNLENENQKLYELQKKANLGGAEGRAASTELKQKSVNVKGRKKTLDLLKQVYQEEYGIEWLEAFANGECDLVAASDWVTL